jgi:hypothetical protein
MEPYIGEREMASKKVVHITVDHNKEWIVSLPMGIKLIVTHLDSGFSSELGEMTWETHKEWDEDIEDYWYPVIGTRSKKN